MRAHRRASPPRRFAAARGRACRRRVRHPNPRSIALGRRDSAALPSAPAPWLPGVGREAGGWPSKPAANCCRRAAPPARAQATRPGSTSFPEILPLLADYRDILLLDRPDVLMPDDAIRFFY